MILCCGEALIDMIESFDNTGKRSFSPHAGGASFNTSIGLGRLRTPVALLSGVSTDTFGDTLQAALEASHVDTTLLQMSDRPTTLAFVRLADGHASYMFYDENTAGRMLSADALPDVPDHVSTIYLGGISLVSEPCAEFYTALATRESENRVIMADPNIRPSLIQDPDTYRARIDHLVSVCDVIKVSDEDLHWMIQEPLSLHEKATLICERGPSLLILTKGGAGALAFTHEGCVADVAAERVEVVDTVGAGDTFNSGVLAKMAELGLLSKTALSQISVDDITAVLAYGAKVAGVTVTRAGASPPWVHELN